MSAWPTVRVATVIPARMASSRFPGKPLLEVRGLPMIEHVRRRALLCRRFSEETVATCDEEIAAVVRGYGGKVVMTSPAHPAATDRVAEAARSIDCTHVVNVQGDEILVLPADLEKMVQAMEKSPHVPAWNAVAPIERSSELGDRSVVKCALSRSGRILFCARDFSLLGTQCPIPTAGPDTARHNPSASDLHGTQRFEPVHMILGILGYRRDFLERYGALPRTPLEVAESIDQSRILEHDAEMRSVPFSKGYIGINEQREVDVVGACLHSDPRQQEILRQVLV